MNKSKEKEYPQYNQRTLRKKEATYTKLVELGMTSENAENILDLVAREPKGLLNFQNGVEYGTELLKSKKLTNPEEVLNVIDKAGKSIKNEIDKSRKGFPYDPNFGSGSIRELEVAVLRIRQGSTEIQVGTIKIGSGGVYKDVGADIVDRTPRIKEAIQVKRVSSDDSGAFWANFKKAIEQLNGNKREEIPRGFRKVADIEISNRNNSTYNCTPESFIKSINQRDSYKELLRDFDGTVFITSGKNQIELNLKKGEIINHSLTRIQSSNSKYLDPNKFTAKIKEVQSVEDRKVEDYVQKTQAKIDSMQILLAEDFSVMQAEMKLKFDKLGLVQPIDSFIEVESPIQASVETMTISLLDLNNYRDYLKSKEYAQTLPPDERIDLGRKANDIIDPLRNDWRDKGRAQTGVNMRSTDPFFQTFKTELELSKKDQAGMEIAREWAARQPKNEKDNTRQDRSQEL